MKALATVRDFSTLSPIVVENEPKRENTSVPLNPAARAVVERVREETGIPKVEALARILEWFGSLDRKLRLAVLTRDEETREELTKLVVRQMAGLPKDQLAESAESLTVEQTLAATRAMIDRLENAHRSQVEAWKEEMKAKRKNS
jgi:hypothetical protein